MEKRRKPGNVSGGVEGTDLDKELQRLVDEKNALLKVMEKIFPTNPTARKQQPTATDQSSVTEANNQKP